MATQRERTFIMVKSDGVQRGLIGEIIHRFEKKGFKLIGMKFLQADEVLLKKHNEELAGLPFAWEGLNVVKTGRDIIGATNPMESNPGTIYGDLCIQEQRELELWFNSKELISWKQEMETWIFSHVKKLGHPMKACVFL
ncbi:nucleoside diphosphate kinase-like [Tachypleus tridentatus]|uniref:nucleoside diphosphate kinase-like n=1 Tax=Tachypleus tridentatus TaxID=6853 RepID=UPI003FD339C6